MPKLLPQPGRAYSFWYPRYNYFGLPKRMEFRHVLVTSVRDTRRDRVDPKTRSLNPTLRRSRWLVTGQDLDKGAERSFYASSMKRIHEFDPMEQGVATANFAVVDRERVVFHARSLGEVVAYVAGAGRGVLCNVLNRQPRRSA